MRQSIKAYTALLTGALAALLSFQPAAAQTITGADGRPDLPEEQTHPTEHFLIHYTLTGTEKINPLDENGDGLPDYVTLVAETLEYVWEVEVVRFGWAAPLFDRGEGGDARIDVYLENQLGEGYAGYVETGAGYVGDNPNTPELERNAAYGFMVLDNDYLEVLRDDTGETPTQLMQATVAHEFHHLVQAAYDDNDPHFWLYEASATWMEDEVFDDVNDGVWYLDAIFRSPDTCLVAEGGTIRSEDDGHWYRTWLLLRLISEQYGHGVVRTIWEHSRRLNGFDSIDAALAPYNTSLLEQSQAFGVANLLRAYEEGDLYPVVKLEGTAGAGIFQPLDGVQSLASDYVQLTARGLFAVTLSGHAAPMTLQAVGVRGAEADVFRAVNGRLVLDTTPYDTVYLIVHNDEKLTYDSDCYFDDYQLTIDPTGEAPAPVEAVWPAIYYESPGESDYSAASSHANRVEDVPYRSGDQEDFAQSPQDLPVDFTVLEPLALPPGYTFDYAYILTAEDLGTNAPYYVPGGGASANMDYLDEEGNWLSIAESISPYADVREWQEAIDYLDAPGTIRQIAGVDVLVEDLSEPGEVWYSATFVINGLFIVVDGDSEEEDVIALVESLIKAANAGAAPAQPQPAPAQPAPIVEPASFWEELFDVQAGGMLGFLGALLCCGGLCVVGGGALVLTGLLLRRRPAGR